MNFSTIELQFDGRIARVTFNRPEVHNAFNAVVIEELRQAFAQIRTNTEIRVAILSGAGKSFCAGADLNWMKSVARQNYQQNLSEANGLAALFYEIYTLPIPVIAQVQGAAIGGGTGFVAVCDMAVAAESSVFSFSEVKIGVVPACIGPYVIKKLGEGMTRELFITGERMTAQRAKEVGLVNKVVPESELVPQVDALIGSIVSSGPKAVATAKKLISDLPGMGPEEFKPYTAEVIAKLRQSDEGQEGMSAFLEKRRPNWIDK